MIRTAKTATITAHNKIKSQWIAFCLAVFLWASCRFMTSSFSEIAFRSSAFASTTVSPSSVLTGVSNTSDMEINISASGTDRPCSHLEIVCLTTFNLIASSSCESPLDFLIVFMFSFSIRNDLLTLPLMIRRIACCGKQRRLTLQCPFDKSVFVSTSFLPDRAFK
ncbi:Uncharacterised protein [Anaerotruncus sp. 2789STDY5834896]|uniref:Uncharacterized protein n=1 Tax=uncultured Anaerotruncus sp. TaxID=905011 RepID=A0A1C6JZL5_9FIRM|nr:Uncharacterised protein [uncultured Anaerotruncus sp.]